MRPFKILFLLNTADRRYLPHLINPPAIEIVPILLAYNIIINGFAQQPLQEATFDPGALPILAKELINNLIFLNHFLFLL